MEVTGISEYAFTAEDFKTSTPYEYIDDIKDPFRQGIVEQELAEYAKSVGFIGFKQQLMKYRKSLKMMSSSTAPQNGLSDFDQQAMEQLTGEWMADEYGIRRYGAMGSVDVACSHPIAPVEKLRNIDTGELKVRLAFRRGGIKEKRVWTEILTDFDTISNAKNILSLAKIGVSVTSGKRAQSLVEYLTDVLDLNYDAIPERRSVSRMGWNAEGFSPYVKDIVFDGNENFGRVFNAIKPRGEMSAWLFEALDARKYSITARILLAASFASVLVEPLGCLPFFVHLWGMDSGTGKTVGQMLAAAVWADPVAGGDYFKTFKGTSVGFEIIAGFLNSLPMFIDELQLSKDSRGKLIFNVYELAAGSGKLRSNKTLGLASVPTWSNCFITSGETPIVGDQDGAGAINRVIEIECKADNKVIRDGHRTANAVKANYGHAGKLFVERLAGDEERVRALYEQNYTACLKSNTTEKQAMAAAIIVTADVLATEWIFKDGRALSVEEISEFLKSKEAVSAADRGYAYMCDWVAQNANKLKGATETGDVYGLIDEPWVYIIRSTFNRTCQEAGISAPALLSHLKSRGLLQTRGRKMTMAKRINGVPTECVTMKLCDDCELQCDAVDELPL